LAFCTFGTRYSATTYWAFCNTPSEFQDKARSAKSTWDSYDTYNYVEYSPSCGFAFQWGYTSFSSQGWGTVAATTWYAWRNGQVDGAQSYFNSDKNWYNSGADGYYWSSDWYDRQTVALHEIGHWMAINHPSSCGENHPEAVMEPIEQTKWWPRTWDLDQLTYLGVKK